MQITKFKINNSKLSMIAAFVWHLTSETAISDSRLLPVINTDLIINLSAPITYRFIEGQDEQASRVHIRYIKQKPQIINQAAEINVWGVSLYPFSAYLLLRTNMSTLEGCVINLQQFNPFFCTTIINGLLQIRESSEGPALIEDALLNWIGNDINIDEIRQVHDFMRNINGLKIGEYCRDSKIGIKRLERLIKKYTGLSPKQLHQVGRFQRAGNDIIYSSVSPSLAALAYSHDYYDQMHMTKDFKEYAGITPFLFLNQHDCMKEKIIEPK